MAVGSCARPVSTQFFPVGWLCELSQPFVPAGTSRRMQLVDALGARPLEFDGCEFHGVVV